MIEEQFLHIVQLIQQSRANALRAVNTELINLYWNVGRFIHQKLQKAEWGDKTVDALAAFIQNSHPDIKGFNRRGLYRMKQFFQTYTDSSVFVSPLKTQIQITQNEYDPIVSPMATQLDIIDIRQSLLAKISWSHHLIILSGTKSAEEKEFYIKLCIKEQYSRRELERQISSGIFERVMIGNQQISPLLREKHPDITNSFKDSYVFEFLHLPEPFTESDLQKGLIRDMKDFILELGKDFLFVGEEYKIQVGNSDFYIDLVFYHRGLQCLVAFELKSDKFKPEYLGKINFYLEALDRDMKKQHENPSIGILLCKDKDTEVVEYALSRSLSPTLVSEYKTQLPDKQVLKQKLHELFEDRKDVNE
jgi:predicted nuclease of restriction endonuclease-like (RecB) superfamily